MYYAVLAVVIIGAQTCPDRWALSKVSVWAHNTSKALGERGKGININQLENYQFIEVTNGNVSVLCDGMVKNFPHLIYLTLIEANISKILPGAFQQLPKLTHLSLSLNHLRSIERYQFQNLQKLTVLYLSSNQIDNIEEDAFADLPNIKKIYLDRNKITEINSKWFLNLPQISLIALSFNKISKVQKNVFTLPKSSVVEIRLQHNLIEEIEPSAVIGLGGDEEVPYLTLRLDRNNLTTITKDFLESMDNLQSNLVFNSNAIQCLPPETIQALKTVSVTLSVLDNPISCDCLDAISNFEKDHVLRATISYNSNLECALFGVKPPTDWN